MAAPNGKPLLRRAEFMAASGFTDHEMDKLVNAGVLTRVHTLYQAVDGRGAVVLIGTQAQVQARLARVPGGHSKPFGHAFYLASELSELITPKQRRTEPRP